MLKGKKIAVIGGGKMGGVIIGGIVSHNLAPACNVTVADKVKERLEELKVLCDPGVRAAVMAMGIELRSFANLPHGHERSVCEEYT